MSGLKTDDNVAGRIDRRLPVFSMLRNGAAAYPTPKNLTYWWNFGSLAGFMLVVMIVTGILLAMNYVPNAKMAFGSVDHIMRDVDYGWLIRTLHMTGATMFFILVYIHFFRGLYYGSYKAPREGLWRGGMLIFMAMMATAFTGIVLPRGQMSFLGITGVTSLFPAFPLVGDATLNRVFALHYLLPFVIVGLVIHHLWVLYKVKPNNPLGIDVNSLQDTIPFHPYYTVKILVGIGVFLLIYLSFVFFKPNFFGDSVNTMAVSTHVEPEWYFLPYYAILRSFTHDIFGITAKLQGVVAMFASILLLFFLPWLDRSKVRSAKFRPIYKQAFWVLVLDVFALGYLGAQPSNPATITFMQIATAYYFFHFFVLLPLLGRFEKPRPLPTGISAPILSGGNPAGPAQPMEKP